MLYLPEKARFDSLLDLPEGADLGKAVNEAMAAIEDTNPDLDGVLPRAYSSLPNDLMVELLRLLGRLPVSPLSLALGTSLAWCGASPMSRCSARAKAPSLMQRRFACATVRQCRARTAPRSSP